MKGLDVKPVAQHAFGFPPQLPDLELANLIGQGLAGNDHIAFNFSDRVCTGDRAVGLHPFYGLLPGPTEGMQTGIDNQAVRSPYIIGQCAQALVRIRI